MQISKANVLAAIIEKPGITILGLCQAFRCTKKNQEEKVIASLDKLLHETKIKKQSIPNPAIEAFGVVICAINGVSPTLNGFYPTGN